jgi:fatty-acid desaturase
MFGWNAYIPSKSRRRSLVNRYNLDFPGTSKSRVLFTAFTNQEIVLSTTHGMEGQVASRQLASSGKSIGQRIKHFFSIINWPYAITFSLMHALALLILHPYFFSWAAVICFWVSVVIFGQLAIPIGYHRLMAHHSFKTPKWFERTLVTLAMCAGQETPARWVAWHRMHHLHSDEHEDPHSPMVSFIWAHVNWLVYEQNHRGQSFARYEKYARDVLRDPYYMWLEKIKFASPMFFLGHALLFFLVTWLVTGMFMGFTAAAWQLTLGIFVWGVIARTVWVWHITWSVNSLAHIFGYRNFETSDASKNNWFVTLLTSGEGWHNNHHADQASATVQIRWWEIDINYYIIWLFSKVGLAWAIVLPRHKRQRDLSDPGVTT